MRNAEKRRPAGSAAPAGRTAAASAALALLCLLLCACGGGGRTDEPYKMYLIAKSTTTEFWTSAFAGAGAAKAEYNVDLTVVGPDTEEDYECQNRYIRLAVQNGADAIIFSAISYSENAEAIDEAANAGVIIVVIDSDVNSDKVSARIGTDNVQAGRMAAEAVLGTEREELYIGVVNFDQTTRNGQEREQGLRDAFARDGRVRAVYTVNVPSTPEAARRGAKQLMAAHPEINALIGLNEPLSVGIALAARELALRDRVCVVGFDSNVKCVDLMRSGDLSALIVQNPYAMGYLGVETAWELLSGASRDARALTDTATSIVTRENMFTEEGQKKLFSFS